MPSPRAAPQEPQVRLPLSFEFFPTKTSEGAVKLRTVRQQLYALKPEFCSVTFGAPVKVEPGEERRAFLDRARLAVIALRDV